MPMNGHRRTPATLCAGLLIVACALSGSGFDAIADSAATTPPATPRATCGPGALPEPDMQGRVPGGAAPEGYTCNITQIGHHGATGGYKALRFTDSAGRECAYYDTTLLFPTNALTLSADPSVGVAVLDMSDPAHPVQTDTLTTPAMLTPHESLELNERRGLLAAVMGNPTAYPGVIDIYDLNEDCRHPKLQSSLPVGLLGHESGFAPDGRTFYATSIGTGQITAVDVTNPKLPVPLWVGDYHSHGLTLSDDGTRAYVAAQDVGVIILDVSEIQHRKPDPQVREISRLSWDTLTIPQVALPVTIGGTPYLVEIDEFSNEGDDHRVARNGSRVGAHASSTSPMNAPRTWYPTSASRCTSRRTGPLSRPTRERTAWSRATRVTTATCRAGPIRASWPARSSSPGCACSTSGIRGTRARPVTSSLRWSRGPARPIRPTTRCLDPRSRRSGGRSGTPTATAVSTRSASPRTRGGPDDH